MLPIDVPALPWWPLLTRMGEAQILLPAAALAVLALLRQPQSRAMAVRWLSALAVAALLTTASKLAFIGWGLGWPSLNFTGVSGHALFAAAVYPLLLGTLAPRTPRLLPVLALALGALLAGLVGWSRLVVQAHSVSEVVAGLALGAAVCAVALGRLHLPPLRFSPWLAVTAAVWLFITPTQAPPSQSHALVTRLALTLSGRLLPYTRADLRRPVTPKSAQSPGLQSAGAPSVISFTPSTVVIGPLPLKRSSAR